MIDRVRDLLDMDTVEADIAALEAKTGVTAGTVTASKAVVVDANKDITGFRNVSATGNAIVGGTLAVTGVTTLTAAPKLTATTAAGAITLTMTNAPAGANAGKAAPIYLTVTVDATTYVVPAWPLA
jgi:phage-related tail fiber protein